MPTMPMHPESVVKQSNKIELFQFHLPHTHERKIDEYRISI